jgi:hypothetical protein
MVTESRPEPRESSVQMVDSHDAGAQQFGLAS